jgi:hypothetical protein
MEIRNSNHEFRNAIISCFDFDIYCAPLNSKSEFELNSFRISTFEFRIALLCSLLGIHQGQRERKHGSFVQFAFYPYLASVLLNNF